MVHNLDQAIEFYSKYFGFSLDHVMHHFASLSFEGQTLELKRGDHEHQSLIFQTENMEAMEQRMLQHKIKFVRPPYRREEETETFNKVFDEFSVEDGEGNTITFSSFIHFKC
jgi:extradiol dioxygenase family protein